jgi:hypothetical protein
MRLITSLTLIVSLGIAALGAAEGQDPTRTKTQERLKNQTKECPALPNCPKGQQDQSQLKIQDRQRLRDGSCAEGKKLGSGKGGGQGAGGGACDGTGPKGCARGVSKGKG